MDYTPVEETYHQGGPRSQAQFERDRQYMPGGAKGAYFYKPFPLTMQRGEGCYLYDIDERQFVDFANHHTAQILGHNHPAVHAAIAAQLSRGIALGAPAGVEAALAEELCSRVTSLERIRFANSGTEATLHAIRLARGFSGKPKIAKFEGGYHGSHDVVEISVAPPLEKAGPDHAPYSVPTAGGISPNTADEVVVLPYHDEESVTRLIEQHRDELACIILDPKAGILPIRDDFVRLVRQLTRDHNLLLILDEVVAFRVGRGGIQESFGIQPDLTTYGKIIGGGFPVGAFGGRADIMDLLDTTQGPTGFFQSGTFSAHPVVMTAGLATLQQLTPDSFDHLNGLGERLRSGLNDLFATKGFAAQALGIGSLFSIYCTDEPLVNYRNTKRNDSTVAHQLFLSLLNQGYFLSQGLIMNSLSLPMQTPHVDGLIAAMEKAIDEVVSVS
ncbi:MAG: aspartate aminotransferase family protein [Chloroflexota bacterium]